MEIVTDVPHREWSDFIHRTPGGSIFQSPDMAQIFEKTKGYRLQVVASLGGGSMRSLISSAIVSYHQGRLAPLASRAIVTGGPVGDPETFPTLLAAHDRLAKRVAVATQVRNLTAPHDKAPFASIGYHWEDHLNYIIDLRSGEKALLGTMSKARRKGIATAEKAGLVMRKVDERNLDQAYGLLQQTYRRARVPLADRSLFHAAVQVLGPRDEILAQVVTHGADVCATRFLLRWDRTLYDWYAGSSDQAREVHADEWLVWELLREGIRRGCTTFDFGGAGPPDDSYGPREFKRRFGGLEFNPGRLQKIYRPLTFRLTKAVYGLWRGWQ